MIYLSLFSVCLHVFCSYRRCDKLPRSRYCFFCLLVKARDFEKISYFLDVVIDERDFQENFCDMVASTIGIDISVERPVYLAESIEKDSQCDYYQKVYKLVDC